MTSDGERDFDVVAVTTSIAIDKPIAAATFAPLKNRTLLAEGVQTLPLLDRGAHVACTVGIGGEPYTFLVDTGAQSVLLDSSVARAAGLPELGSLEARGATRTGGLHVVRIPTVDVGNARLDDLVATSLDLRQSTGGAVRFDGILGYPFFASSLVELDFANHVMRFGAPGSFVPRGEKIGLDLDRGLVEATFRIDNRLDAPFIVDTGNSGEMLLYRAFIEQHPGLVPLTGRSAVSYGIGGASQTYRTTLDAVQLGS
ncbi:MAG: aspartyl protease family protein, partial [Myxococcales bacterium]|nr:aspartyl protease family protein [Myxococcales bacterium]